MSQATTVTVVDDDLEVRESLAALISSSDVAVECYASGREFFEGYSRAQPGCIVLDLRLPWKNGLEILDEMAARKINVPVIMISGHGDIAAAVSAMKAGAIDFFEKPFRGAALLESVRRAIDLDLRQRRAQAEHNRLRTHFESLTPEEQEVLRLTKAGKPDKAIAMRLDLSLRTVQLRRASLMRKMDVPSRAELICLAQGLEDSLR